MQRLVGVAFVGLVLLTFGSGSSCRKEEEPPETEEEPTSEQVAAAEAASQAAVDISGALLFSDELFNFDPDLDPEATDEQNTETIEQNADSASGGCAVVTVQSPNVLSIDFGAGCTLGQLDVSGAVTVGVTVMGPDTGAEERSVTVDLSMDNLSVEGLVFDGDISFVTQNGYRLDVLMDLTVGSTALEADLEVTGAAGFFTVSGTASVNGGAELALDGVRWNKGDCYPSAGSAETAGVSLAFEAQTATTGQTTMTFPVLNGEATICYALPSYGSCVATACE